MDDVNQADVDLANLSDLFPDYPIHQLQTILRDAGGDLAAAVDAAFAIPPLPQNDAENPDLLADADWPTHDAAAAAYVLDNDDVEAAAHVLDNDVQPPLLYKVGSAENPVLVDEDDGPGSSNSSALGERRFAHPKGRFAKGKGAASDLKSVPSRSGSEGAQPEKTDVIVLDGGSSSGMQLTAMANTEDERLTQTGAANPPPKEPTPLDLGVAALTAMFPDAHKTYLRTELKKNRLEVAATAEFILEKNGKYPKRQDTNPVGTADVKGKGKKRELGGEEGVDMAGKKAKPTYKDYEVVRPDQKKSDAYVKACHAQLRKDFPLCPDYYVRSQMQVCNNQYIPTRLALDAQYLSGQLPFKELKAPFHAPKGKHGTNEEFKNEYKTYWDHHSLAGDNPPEQAGDPQDAGGPSSAAAGEKDPDDGTELECGCCFMDYPHSKMTQCEDGHLFCMECARKAAENLIGLRKTEIRCIDSSSDCKYYFAMSQIKRFLTAKVLEGYLRLCQEEEIRLAGLSDLESCPFCPFAMIMETTVEENKLFTCQNEECKAITCRTCKRHNHLPMTCEDAAKEDVLDVRHTIEEAMTNALLRDCPKCKNRYFKTEGCNKMQCSCGQMMCYVCRQAIQGYDHFNQLPAGVPNPKGGKCPLWDDANKRNAEEVARAGEEAIREAREENPEVNGEELHVELPNWQEGAGAQGQGLGAGGEDDDNDYNEDDDDEIEYYAPPPVLQPYPNFRGAPPVDANAAPVAIPAAGRRRGVAPDRNLPVGARPIAQPRRGRGRPAAGLPVPAPFPLVPPQMPGAFPGVPPAPAGPAGPAAGFGWLAGPPAPQAPLAAAAAPPPAPLNGFNWLAAPPPQAPQGPQPPVIVQQVMIAQPAIPPAWAHRDPPPLPRPVDREARREALAEHFRARREEVRGRNEARDDRDAEERRRWVREDAARRIERLREEVARRGEEAARRGEEAARRGEEAARRGEEAARRVEAAARLREQAARRIEDVARRQRDRDREAARRREEVARMVKRI
ncbi:hypothetical protein HK097_011102 [Rhizophlyctis rosea]|uniref:RING-type domain-containing protein n=1 Tax=Rhizophlyctis rosea TaxID=64517 RepID=A0AAD5S8F9_9FUNG|nr:hypothetical protein HK097_011102 [Rhizophlyctis rosea]